jgi:diaminopimelate epimerase
MRIPFAKMHGLGNDIVVIDARRSSLAVTPALARAWADRRRGIGFDQLALVEAAEGADLSLRFWNADGSAAGTCGNATRCIARAEMDRTGRDRLVIATPAGRLEAHAAGPGLTSVNMGPPRTRWQDIPLARACDTDRLPIPGEPVATSMGNPHCTFLVADAEGPDLAAFGAAQETHPLFPERTNVQLVQVLAPDRLRVRVWERGAGITLASGSSSCAAVVAAARRGAASRRATVVLDGGELVVDWREDGVWMTGPSAHVFDGWIEDGWIEP